MKMHRFGAPLPLPSLCPPFHLPVSSLPRVAILLFGTVPSVFPHGWRETERTPLCMAVHCQRLLPGKNARVLSSLLRSYAYGEEGSTMRSLSTPLWSEHAARPRVVRRVRCLERWSAHAQAPLPQRSRPTLPVCLLGWLLVCRFS